MTTQPLFPEAEEPAEAGKPPSLPPLPITAPPLVAAVIATVRQQPPPDGDAGRLTEDQTTVAIHLNRVQHPLGRPALPCEHGYGVDCLYERLPDGESYIGTQCVWCRQVYPQPAAGDFFHTRGRTLNAAHDSPGTRFCTCGNGYKIKFTEQGLRRSLLKHYRQQVAELETELR